MGKSMTESDYLNPGDIQSQCTSATSIIQDNNTSLTVAKTALAGFVSSGKQEGAAVDSLRLLISDFYTVADSVSVANGLTAADFNSLSSDVGSEELDGSVIIPGMRDAKASKEKYEDLAQEYYDEMANPSSIWTWFAMGDLSRAAVSCSQMASSYESKYNEYKRQKEAWEDIESSTSGLFADDAGLRGLIADAVANMNGCYEGGIYVPDPDAAWRTEMADAQEKTARTALLHSGVTEEQIDYMCNDLNYTAVELLNDWSLCLTDTDKEFFLHLMDGEDGYQDAFAIFPDDLSASMALVLGNYSGHLLVFDENGNLVDGEKRFEAFNNAVLASTSHKDTAADDTVEFGMKKYLEMLMAGSQILMQGDATVLAACGPNAEGLEDLYSRYYSRVMSANMWSTELAVKEMVGSSNETKKLMNIENLSITSVQDYSFKVNYMGWWGPKQLSVDGNTVERAADMNAAYDLQELYELKKEQEQLVQKTLINIATDLTIAALAVYCPPAAIAAGGVKMLASGKASSPSGMSHYTDQWIENYTKAQVMTEANAAAFTKKAKTGVSGVTTIAVDGVNLILDMQRAEQEYSEANTQKFLKRFGMMNTANIFVDGEDERAITYAGLYNPKALYLMGEWEANGCDSFVDFKDNMSAEQVLEKVRGNKKYSDETKECAEKMLTGDGTLFSEDLDMEVMLKADELIADYTEGRERVIDAFSRTVNSM